MTVRSKLAIIIMAFTASDCGAQIITKANGDQQDEFFQATVRVVAFELRGTLLGAPKVRLFEATEGHGEFSSAFHDGIAEHVPFGEYKIEAYMDGFYAETRYVAVYRKDVTVIVGLPFGREAMTLPTPPSLHGKVSGSLPQGKKSFVRLVGIYSSWCLESAIGADGGFDFSIPWDGKYQLLVVNEDGVLASRTVSSPYSGSPLEVAIGSFSGLPAR